MQYFFTGSIIAFNFFSPGYINSLFLRREKKKVTSNKKRLFLGRDKFAITHDGKWK